MTNLTAKDLDVLCHILTGEEMACKKARVYANTLTDAALAEEMERMGFDKAKLHVMKKGQWEEE